MSAHIRILDDRFLSKHCSIRDGELAALITAARLGERMDAAESQAALDCLIPSKRQMAAALGSAALLNVVANAALIPRFGVHGAAMATASSSRRSPGQVTPTILRPRGLSLSTTSTMAPTAASLCP